jgi:hypothetical protein
VAFSDYYDSQQRERENRRLARRAKQRAWLARMGMTGCTPTNGNPDRWRRQDRSAYWRLRYMKLKVAAGLFPTIEAAEVGTPRKPTGRRASAAASGVATQHTIRARGNR